MLGDRVELHESAWGGRCLAPWASLVSVGQADSAMVSTDMRLVAWENGARSGHKRRRKGTAGDVECCSTSSTYHTLLKEITRGAADVKYNARVGVCPIISVSQSSVWSDMSVGLSTMSWGHVTSETPGQNVAVGSYMGRHWAWPLPHGCALCG